jgi:zona occludens toxin
MIYLITGTPGAGKSLFAVSEILKFLENKENKGRKIYTNIDGIRLDDVCVLSDDEKNTFDWRKFDDGAVFFIDEAQNYPCFGSTASEKNAILTDLTIHRHRNFDFYFITQSPIFLHKVVCKLAFKHFHLTRMFGHTRSYIYAWSGHRLDPTCKISKDCSEQRKPFNFPKNLYSKYKSASSHSSVKSYIPDFIKSRGLFLLLLLSVLIYTVMTSEYVEKYFMPKKYASKHQKVVNSPLVETNQGNIVNSSNSSTNAQIQPQKAQFIYDASKPLDYNYQSENKPTEQIIFAGAVRMGKKCVVYDRQGTHIKTDDDTCIKVANGVIPFQPYKIQQQARLELSSESLAINRVEATPRGFPVHAKPLYSP